MKSEPKIATKKPLVISKVLKYCLILFKGLPMESNGLASFLPLIFLFGIFYFLIIRPQQKQQKEHSAMIDALAKGDKIITTGGLHATIVKPEEDFIKIKLNDDTIVKLEKQFVSKKVELSNENA
jgi:preprotein translocase subunit YajC